MPDNPKTPEQAEKDYSKQESQKTQPPTSPGQPQTQPSQTSTQPNPSQASSKFDSNADKTAKDVEYRASQKYENDQKDEEDKTSDHDRVAQAEDSFDKLTEKLNKAKERYEKSEKQALEAEGKLNEWREKRLKYNTEYDNLLSEVNRRSKLVLSK